MNMDTEQTLAGRDFSTSFLIRLKRNGSKSRWSFCRPSLSETEYSDSNSPQLSNLKNGRIIDKIVMK